MTQPASKPRIKLIQGNIVEQRVEAIVNATNRHLAGQGGVASSIRLAAGKEFEKHCFSLIPLNVGEAKITPGYDLPVSWIIHTHRPLWIDGVSGKKEEELLAQCYRNSLALVEQYNIKSVAFPCIATGIHGFPKDKAAVIAVGEVTHFLKNNSSLQELIFVCWKQADYRCYQKALRSLASLVSSSKNRKLQSKQILSKVDYTHLKQFLKEGDWKQADLETRRLMLAVVGANTRKEILLTQDDIKTFPCQVLHKIDRLWKHYSQDRFGFSVILQIYQEEGKDYAKLASRVGWRVDDKWLKYEEINFKNKAQKGHLPLTWLVPTTFWMYWSARFASAGWRLLLERMEECQEETHPPKL